MAIGLPITRAVLDSKIGNLALQARQWAQSVTQLEIGVVSAGGSTPAEIDAYLVNTFGYTAAEAALIRAAVGPMLTARTNINNGKGAMDKVTGIE